MSDSRTVGRSDRLRQRAHMLAALVLAFQSVGPTVQLSAQMSPRDSAFHALNRLAYGPRPGEVERVAAQGVMSWIERELSPDRLDDGRLAARERQFRILHYDAGDLATMYLEAQRERRERKLAAGGGADSMADQPASPQTPLQQEARLLAGQ